MKPVVGRPARPRETAKHAPRSSPSRDRRGIGRDWLMGGIADSSRSFMLRLNGRSWR